MRLGPARSPLGSSPRGHWPAHQPRSRPSGAEVAQVVGVPIDGMAAPIQTECFLLVPQLLGLGPWRRPSAGRSHTARGHPDRGRRRSRPAPPGPSRSRCVRAPCSHARVDGAQQRAPMRRRQGGRFVADPTSESQAPDFTSASNTRLFARRRSRILAERVQRRDRRPALARTAMIDLIAPSPTFLMAVRPNRTPAGLDR